MDHLDSTLAGLDVTLTDETLDRIDAIVPPGTDIGRLDMATTRRPSSRPASAGVTSTSARPPDELRWSCPRLRGHGCS